MVDSFVKAGSRYIDLDFILPRVGKQNKGGSKFNLSSVGDSWPGGGSAAFVLLK